MSLPAHLTCTAFADEGDGYVSGDETITDDEEPARLPTLSGVGVASGEALWGGICLRVVAGRVTD